MVYNWTKWYLVIHITNLNQRDKMLLLLWSQRHATTLHVFLETEDTDTRNMTNNIIHLIHTDWVTSSRKELPSSNFLTSKIVLKNHNSPNWGEKKALKQRAYIWIWAWSSNSTCFISSGDQHQDQHHASLCWCKALEKLLVVEVALLDQ